MSISFMSIDIYVNFTKIGKSHTTYRQNIESTGTEHTVLL